MPGIRSNKEQTTTANDNGKKAESTAPQPSTSKTFKMKVVSNRRAVQEKFTALEKVEEEKHESTTKEEDATTYTESMLSKEAQNYLDEILGDFDDVEPKADAKEPQK